MKKRIISLLTALALSLSLFPVWAGAAGTDGTLCPHHPAHDGDCGFAAPSEGHPCGHTHTAACYTNGQLPGGADYETAPDAQELLNCPHVHDAECGFAEPNGGTDCAFVCNICPVEALIAQLPAEVTPDNAGDVRAQLEEILALFAALDEVEQGNVDISRCYELQAALDAANVAAPVEDLTELDLSNAADVKDKTNGYTWETTDDGQKILTLYKSFPTTKVIIPDTAVTIKAMGECTIGELYVASPQNTKLTISGEGTLTVTNHINFCGGHGNTLTVAKGATLKAQGGISIGADGGAVDGIVTVEGTLTASEGYSWGSLMPAITAGTVTVTGSLTVSELEGVEKLVEQGVVLAGRNVNGQKDFNGAFIVKDGGTFTANCTVCNVRVNSNEESGFNTETEAAQVIVITDEYMPGDCVQYKDGGTIQLNRLSTGEEYTGLILIHQNHDIPSDKWKTDKNGYVGYHWRECTYPGCGKREDYEKHSPLEWSKDSTNHWRECSKCHEKEIVPHDWKLASEGTSMECSICHFKQDVVVTISGIPESLTYGKIGTVTPKYTTNPEQTFTTEKWELSPNTVALSKDGSLPANLPAGNYTLTFKGTRADNITIQGSTTFKVNPAPLTVASVTAEGRPYDGTNTVNITGVTLNGIVNSDDVSVNTTDLKGTLNGSDAGNYTSITLSSPTLTGTAKDNYTLTQTGTVPTDVTISQAPALTLTPATGNLEVVNNRAHTYTYGLGALLPDITADKSLGTPISYTLDEASLSNLGSYYTTGAKIDEQTLTLPIQEVTTEEEKEIGTIRVTIKTRNYEDMTATIKVQSVNKTIPTGQPILTPENLTYGQPLKSITLSGSMKDGATDVTGTFEWIEYNICPDVQEAYPAAWKFSPKDTGRYISVDGTSNIKVLPLSIEGAEITLTHEYFPYDGEAHKPEITSVKLNGNLLTADKDYTADIPEGIAMNAYTITLTGKGNYTGKATTKFLITLNDKLGIEVGDLPPSSADKIKQELEHKILIEWVDSNKEIHTEFFDVVLMYRGEDGVWRKAEKLEDLPSGGMPVTLPYPPGTGASGFEFNIKHLITVGSLDPDKKVGDIETIDYELSDAGLECTFTSFSPVAIAYRAATPKPAPSGGGGGGSSSRTHPVKTEQSDHGSITAAPSSASPGATITLTVSPDSGYRLDTLTVTDASGKTVKVTARPDGTYTFLMPNSAVTVTASFTSGDPEETCPRGKDCPSLKFIDLGGIGTWYHEAVDYVLLNALMSGYGNATFGPNDNVTRAQFAQILYNRAGHPAVTGPSGFTDVLPGAWYAPAVTWAAGQGVVLGYGNGLFGPDDSITREQLAAMLWRYAGRPVATEKELHFSDADKISPYALDALCWAVENGIVNGMGNNILSPQGLATRAQVAQMLMNYLENT